MCRNKLAAELQHQIPPMWISWYTNEQWLTAPISGNKQSHLCTITGEIWRPTMKLSLQQPTLLRLYQQSALMYRTTLSCTHEQLYISKKKKHLKLPWCCNKLYQDCNQACTVSSVISLPTSNYGIFSTWHLSGIYTFYLFQPFSHLTWRVYGRRAKCFCVQPFSAAVWQTQVLDNKHCLNM